MLCSTVSDRNIQTNTFLKPTSGNTILHAQSCHPHHVIKGVPVGECYRAKRNCSQVLAYNKQVSAIKSRLSKKAYPKWTLYRVISISDSKPREELLEDMPKIKEDKGYRGVPSVTIDSEEFKAIQNIVKKTSQCAIAGQYTKRIF